MSGPIVALRFAPWAVDFDDLGEWIDEDGEPGAVGEISVHLFLKIDTC